MNPTSELSNDPSMPRGVAQICNLLYRRIVFCRPCPTQNAQEVLKHTADCKSAIQQIANLRYGCEISGLERSIRRHAARTPAMLALVGLLANGAFFTTTAATVIRGPYLQMGTPTSVVVRWRTDDATDSRVRFGSSPASLTRSADNAVVTAEHEVLVSGLTPNTQYYYSVGTAAETLAGGDNTYFFVTHPSGGTATPTRVWVLGDSGTASDDAEEVRDAYYNFTGARHTDLWLMLGDNAYSSGSDSDYQDAVFDMYPTMLRKSVLWPTLGNHDDHGDDSPMFDIFTLPTDGESGGLASGSEHYFSFNFGDIHFICLDSNDDLSANGSMATWLRGDLAATTATWIIAYCHHPPYSKGSHDSDDEDPLVQMRENFLPILEAGGADLVLAGHSHSYERSVFINGHYGNSSTFNASYVVDAGNGRNANAYRKGPGLPTGTVYAVAGSSGQTSGGSLDHPAMFLSLDELGCLVLDFTDNRLDVQFLDSQGAVRDSFSIVNETTTLPPTPADLTAVPGLNRVDLSWSASSGAASYKVKRSTINGGPYTPIASGLTKTTYTDTDAVYGTTYYYVVSAANNIGESPNSNQASATPSGQNGSVRFSSEAHQMNESGNSVHLTVSRVNGSDGTVTVAFATTDTGGGNATSGQDYLPTNGTLSFGPGVTSVSFDIAILDDVVFETDETIVVKLSNPGGGATLAEPSSSTVTIAENEHCALAISPTSRTHAPAGGSDSIQVSATQGCPWAAATSTASWISISPPGSGTGNGSVEYLVEPNLSTEPRMATLTIADELFRITQQGVPPPDATPPTVAIQSPASNSRQTESTITVGGRASDTIGVTLVEYRLENSAGVSDYAPATGTENWTALISGLVPGTNTIRVRAHDAAGNLSAEATRAVQFVEVSRLTLSIDGNGSVTPLVDGQMLDVGVNYTIQARPALKHLFKSWGGNIESRANPLTFTMQRDFVLQAQFIPSQFNAVAGDYNGLFTEEAVIRHESSGFLTAKVSDLGRFSAKLILASRRYSIKGAFGPDGRTTNVIARIGASPLTVVLELDLAQGTDQLEGLIHGGNWQSPLTAHRYVLPATPLQVRRYTLISPGAIENPAGRPGGDSYGMVTIDARNYLIFSATLADGTKVAQKVPLSTDGWWPLYVPLYSGGGSILSRIRFTNDPSNDFMGTLNWFKPAVPTARFYPAGFAVQQELSGSRYQPPTSPTGRVLDFSQGKVKFSAGNLSAPFEVDISLAEGNIVTATNNQLRLAISLPTGLFRGTMILPGASRSVPFTGVLHQKGNYGSGFFLGTSQSGQVRVSE